MYGDLKLSQTYFKGCCYLQHQAVDALLAQTKSIHLAYYKAKVIKAVCPQIVLKRKLKANRRKEIVNIRTEKVNRKRRVKKNSTKPKIGFEKRLQKGTNL